MKFPKLVYVAVSLCLFSAVSMAQDTGTLDQDKVVAQPKSYSPFVDQHFPQQVFFGDMHHHSSLSVDSGLIGNTNGPEVSFRFARGEVVTSNTGQPVKLKRPLDFLVVTDHAARGISRHREASLRGRPRVVGNRHWQRVVRANAGEPGRSLASSRFHAAGLRFRRTEI
jgi:hypothetical protein